MPFHPDGDIIDAISLLVNSLDQHNPKQLGCWIHKALIMWTYEVRTSEEANSWKMFDEEKKIEELTSLFITQLQYLAITSEHCVDPSQHYYNLRERAEDIRRIMKDCVKEYAL